mmetsp:Transcript_26115/g.62300  ORF Transcript_26115/g.62300 Transcript_26115/m.62300 type:complete len:303 (-) Transcript_26115:107-1015(-)
MLPLLLAPTAWHPPARRLTSARRRSCTARMGGPYKVEVLPPIGDDSSLPKKGKGAVLGEESVGIVFELVFRDIKMLSRTALQRPWPVVIGLAQERLDMVVWFAKYKADQCNLQLHDEVARSLEPLPAPRRVKSLLTWHRARLAKSLDDSRSDLWPTLRVLLQRPSMHERIVLAARSQALLFKQSAIPGKRRLTLLGMPRRALSLWLAIWSAWLYGLRWLLVEVARRASVFADVWQPARTRLIEEALVHGVELQRRVDQIQPFQPRLLPSTQGDAPRPLSAALGSARRWTSWFRRWPLRPLPG